MRYTKNTNTIKNNSEKLLLKRENQKREMSFVRNRNQSNSKLIVIFTTKLASKNT